MDASLYSVFSTFMATEGLESTEGGKVRRVMGCPTGRCGDVDWGTGKERGQGRQQRVDARQGQAGKGIMIRRSETSGREEEERRWRRRGGDVGLDSVFMCRRQCLRMHTLGLGDTFVTILQHSA
jgi:hypothetical protein